MQIYCADNAGKGDMVKCYNDDSELLKCDCNGSIFRLIELEKYQCVRCKQVFTESSLETGGIIS